MLYGSDSATDGFQSGTTGERFYIGELGSVGSATTDYFNSSTADYANNNGGFVQGFWFLGSKPSGSSYTDESWGAHMAQMAIAQVTSSAYSKYGIGLIYADVEVGYWNGTTDENYATVKGFCNELSQQSYVPGIYSAPDAWTEICGSNSAQAIAPGYGWSYEPQYTSSATIPSSFAPETFSDYNNEDIIMWQYYSSDSADYDAYVD
ncbi:hypothetical protein [Sulfoacidibacillus thermotolerans]|uniref:DUF1906 domain-containing protein n=1 Tax=Sulfoacidibacillus thermotolerans TaxID=1765684 RepID=A0A2U3CT68_SULT2|nr:hypothetical protein [Sulfoacidibacillus thermotolerans]PWI52212.1 hypothetical protein BM613_14160 [Sulfoacidibacillus thermotolerans]